MNDAWETRNKQSELTESFQAAVQGVGTQEDPSILPDWEDGTESLKRKRQLTFSESSTGEDRAVQRENSVHLQTVHLKYLAEYWSAHACEETIQGWEENKKHVPGVFKVQQED